MKTKTVHRYDRSLGVVHLDKNRKDGILASLDEKTGFLMIDANITRTGVFTYSDREGNEWGELRTDAEVFHPEAMRSFNLVHLTDDHPEDFVDHSNVVKLMRGMVGDIRRDGDFVRALIKIQHKGMIDKVRAGKSELSCGYTATVILEDGVADDGTPFSARQTEIRGNHVALVDEGRAGPDCCLLLDRSDAAFTTFQDTRSTMNTKKIAVGGADYEVPTALADALEKERKDKKDQFPPKEEEEEEEEEDAGHEEEEEDQEEEEEEKDKDKGKGDAMAKMQAKLDKLQARVDAQAVDKIAAPALIDARVELIADARVVLGPDVTTRGVADVTLMRKIVLTVRPQLKDKLEANKKRPDYLRAHYEDAMERHRANEVNATELNTTMFNAVITQDSSTELADAVGGFFDKLKGKRNAAS